MEEISHEETHSKLGTKRKLIRNFIKNIYEHDSKLLSRNFKNLASPFKARSYKSNSLKNEIADGREKKKSDKNSKSGTGNHATNELYDFLKSMDANMNSVFVSQSGNRTGIASLLDRYQELSSKFPIESNQVEDYFEDAYVINNPNSGLLEQLLNFRNWNHTIDYASVLQTLVIKEILKSLQEQEKTTELVSSEIAKNYIAYMSNYADQDLEFSDTDLISEFIKHYGNSKPQQVYETILLNSLSNALLVAALEDTKMAATAKPSSLSLRNALKNDELSDDDEQLLRSVCPSKFLLKYRNTTITVNLKS